MKEENHRIDFVGQLRGGNKNVWLRQNRPMIIWYHELFGRGKTIETFHLKPWTLDELLRFDKKPQGFKLAKVDHAFGLSQIASAGVAENRMRLNELEIAFSKFVETVGSQWGQAIAALMGRLIQLDSSFDVSGRPDPLNVYELIRQGCEYQKRVDEKVKKLRQDNRTREVVRQLGSGVHNDRL